jgi:uncharacterized protein YceH (UPF0502 family)
VDLTGRAQRVLGALVEKSLATPDQYPLSRNALRTACNQSTGRDPVVAYEESDVLVALEELRGHELVRTVYGRSSRVPKAEHRLGETFDLDRPQLAVLALLLLRGPQTVGELRSRSGRLHPFATTEEVEAVLGGLATHRFQPLVTGLDREPGRREARWTHRLGTSEAVGDTDRPDGAGRSAKAGRVPAYQAFHDAVLADDWETAIAQLADDVVFRSPAVHRPYEGAAATSLVLRAVSQVFEGFRYGDVFDEGDRAVLRFTAHVGDRQVEGIDLLRFDAQGRIAEFTVMIRPLSGLTALVERMQAALAAAQRVETTERAETAATAEA